MNKYRTHIILAFLTVMVGLLFGFMKWGAPILVKAALAQAIQNQQQELVQAFNVKIDTVEKEIERYKIERKEKEIAHKKEFDDMKQGLTTLQGQVIALNSKVQTIIDQNKELLALIREIAK